MQAQKEQASCATQWSCGIAPRHDRGLAAGCWSVRARGSIRAGSEPLLRRERSRSCQDRAAAAAGAHRDQKQADAPRG
eukprot:2813687-Rhodomonas_salina.2